MKKIIVILMLYILFTGCKKNETLETNQAEETVTSVANSNLIENIRDIPVDAVFYNECCNENVYLTGIGHFVITNNIIHIKLSNIAGTGLSTGLAYTSTSPLVQTNIFYSNHYEGTLIFTMNLKNENGCGFKIKAQFHATMNANGIITASFANINTTCH